MLELRLIEQGFEVRQARSVKQTLKAMEKGEIDIVVSEAELGTSDGFALLTEVRKQPWGKQLPWVFVTIRSAGNAAQRAFELGAADFVLKPASPEVLVAKLRQILEREGERGGTGRGVRGQETGRGLYGGR